MAELNWIGAFLLSATTHPEFHEGSEAHTCNHLRIGQLPKQGSLSQCHGIDDPQPAHRLRFTPDGTSPKEHQGATREATPPHKPTAPCQTNPLSCGPTAPCPVFVRTRACPGIAVVWMEGQRVNPSATLEHPIPQLRGPTDLPPTKMLPAPFAVTKCHR